MKILKAAVALTLAFSFVSGEAMANCVNCKAPGGPDNTTVWSIILVGCGLCGLPPDHAGSGQVRVGSLFDANAPGDGLIQVGGSSSVNPVIIIQDNGTSYTVDMSSEFSESNGNIYRIDVKEIVDKQSYAVLSMISTLEVFGKNLVLKGTYTSTDNNPNMYSLAPSTYEIVFSNGAIITLQGNFDPSNPLNGLLPVQPVAYYPGEYTNSSVLMKMFLPPNI